MFQNILVAVTFLLAFTYLARMVYRSFRPKAVGCAKGCGACTTQGKEAQSNSITQPASH